MLEAEKYLYEIVKLTNIIDKWDLNRITDKQLTLSNVIASGGQGEVRLGKYFSMNVIVKVLHSLEIDSFTTEVTNTYKYRVLYLVYPKHFQ